MALGGGGFEASVVKDKEGLAQDAPAAFTAREVKKYGVFDESPETGCPNVPDWRPNARLLDQADGVVPPFVGP